MKRLVSIATAVLAGNLLAGTYTWTGDAKDGLWYTAGNWNYNGEPAESSPGSSPAHDVVIDGNDVVVTYVPQGDFSPQAGVTITVSNGAKLVQETGGNWVGFQSGAELILDGGTYDGGPSWNFQLNAGKLTIRNGGEFKYTAGGLSRSSGSVITLESGTMVLGGNVTLYPSDTLGRGSLATTGEATITGNMTFDGFSLSCSTFTPQNDPTITLKEGSLSTRRTADASDSGFWGGCTVDIIVGKVASFSALVHNDKTAYDDTYRTFRFKYNGNSLTESEFNEIFTTTTSVDGDWTRYTISTEEVVGAPAIASHSASYSESTLVFAAELESSSAADTVLTLYYDTSDHEHNTSFGWPNVVPLVLDSSDGLFKATVTVPDEALYYYLIGASSESTGQRVWVADTVIAADMPTDSNVWLGNTSDMTVASNWSKNVVPGANDIVEVNRFFSKGDHIDWDVSAVPAVAGWRQDYSTIVTFNSTTGTPFTVAGDVNLSAGSWAHQGPAAEPSCCVNVRVAGNLTISADAKIAANQKGYHRAGPGRSVNYGTLEDGVDDNDNPVVRQLWTGGAYAGDAGHPTYTGSFVSYGSILNPLDWGSAGKGDTDEKGYSGGGLIILSVGGMLTVNGNIEANGFGWNLDDFAGSSGGTINVTVGTIAGNGMITANGGNCNCGPGGGGRIRVALTEENATFANFGAPDHIVANSGTLEPTANQTLKRDTMIGAAGTITLVSGGETKVIVADTCSTRREPTTETLMSATHLPAVQNGDSMSELKHTKWELSGHGAIRLTRDVQIASLSLAAADGTQKVYTDGFKLTTPALVVNGSRFRSGTYTAETNPEFIVGGGSVTVGKGGFAVFVR